MDGHYCNLYLPSPLLQEGGAAAGTAITNTSWPFPPAELPHPPLQELSAGMATAAVEEEQLKRALLRTTLEFESARMAAEEELRRMKSHALHLTHLLHLATRERDDARHALFLLRQPRRRGDDSDDDPRCHRPPASSHSLDNVQPFDFQGGGAFDVDGADTAEEGSKGTTASAAAEVEAAAALRGLPEKGRLVEAVMRAGPLLQTLMLAGPLPQWRHPPPELLCSDIPPVAISLNHRTVDKDGTAMLAGTARSLSSSSTPSPPSVWNHSSSSSSPESNHSRSGTFTKHQKLACFSGV